MRAPPDPVSHRADRRRRCEPPLWRIPATGLCVAGLVMAALTGCGTSSLTTVPGPAASAVPLAPEVTILAQSSAPNPVVPDRQRDRLLVLTTARHITLPELYDQQRAFMLAHGWRIRHQPRLTRHAADPTIPGIRLAELIHGVHLRRI